MPFNSIQFIFFFIFFTVVYYSISNSLKTFWIIGGSYIFYAYSNIFNLIFLIITTIITFYISKSLVKNKNKNVLFLGIAAILTQLILAKYSTELFNELSTITIFESTYLNFLILPIGISFYSLQAVSLLLDVQKDKFDKEINFKEVSQFLCFFPQSISGPIHRANELIPQFNNKNDLITKNLVSGFKILLWGYFCKLIIADKIEIITTPIFDTYIIQDGLSLLLAAFLYSFQIYFDFWGYSLIAMGTGRILGFSININFMNPYSAKSLKDFWQRWHMTLSKWMRDYIYISLGGNRQKKYLFFFFSILITFLISGFWHGVTLNFIIWGAIHGFLYISENLLSKLFSFNFSRFYSLFINPFRTMFVFIIITFTWLIFRTESTSELISLINKILTFSQWNTRNMLNNYLTITNTFYLVVVLLSIVLSQTKFIIRLSNNDPVSNTIDVYDSLFVCLCLFLIILWGDIGGHEFLYFKF